MKKNLLITITVLSALLSLCGCAKKNNELNTSDFNVVASFYPMDILAKNLTGQIDGVGEISMSDPNLGCIHDHTFTTDDLMKIENADVFVENGLDMEVFNDRIKEAYPDTAIIDASANVANTISDGDEINPHVWTNPDNYILQIKQVSKELQKLNPQNSEKYAANEAAYINRINEMTAKYSEKLLALKGQKALVLDEVLPYFCQYLGMEICELPTDHEQGAVSADALKDVIRQMQTDNIKIILVTKDSDLKNANAIAAETGASIYELNSCMVGNVDKDAYIKDMSENFDIISNIK